jgi:enterochelin esterase-like enzyme
MKPFRTPLLLLICCAALTLALAPPCAAADVAGRCLRTRMKARSLDGRMRTVRVYLPPSYDTSATATRRYPVVYLLHGWPGSDGNWVNLGKACQTADDLIRNRKIPEVILVFPNGAGTGLLGRSLWMDSYDGRGRIETYVAKDLVAWTDSLYRTVREARARAVIGLSDGGTGAFNLAFRYPDLFGACASHSGEFCLRRTKGDGKVVGPEPGATAFLERNSPAEYVESIVERVKRLVLYFDCGSSDESMADNRAFHERLTALGIPHEFHEFPGSHDWSYWREHLRDSLVAVTRRMW